MRITMGLRRMKNSSRPRGIVMSEANKLDSIMDRLAEIEQKHDEDIEALKETLDEIIEKLDNIGLPGSDYGVIDT